MARLMMLQMPANETSKDATGKGTKRPAPLSGPRHSEFSTTEVGPVSESFPKAASVLQNETSADQKRRRCILAESVKPEPAAPAQLIDSTHPQGSDRTKETTSAAIAKTEADAPSAHVAAPAKVARKPQKARSPREAPARSSRSGRKIKQLKPQEPPGANGAPQMLQSRRADIGDSAASANDASDLEITVSRPLLKIEHNPPVDKPATGIWSMAERIKLHEAVLQHRCAPMLAAT